jgi:hypothetical protein
MEPICPPTVEVVLLLVLVKPVGKDQPLPEVPDAPVKVTPLMVLFEPFTLMAVVYVKADEIPESESPVR